MNKMYALIALFSLSYASAQDCATPSASQEFNLNNLSVIVNSGEAQFTSLAGFAPGFEAPVGSGVHAVYASHFWMGGIAPDQQMKLAGGTYAGQETDFYSGPLSLTSAVSSPENCAAYDMLVTVCEYESIRHLQYFNCLEDPDCDVDAEFPNGYTIPDVFYTYPAHGDLSLNQNYYLAPFYDFNEDGNYVPEDGDCPLFISMTDDLGCATCSALAGHKATFWITNDKGGIHSATQGEPIGIEIHNVTYAYSSTNYLNDVVFSQKQILNRGTNTISESYVGTWIDTDLGNPTDDLVGCDIDRNMGFVYNGDAMDEASNASPGYQAFPPAFGVKILKGIEADENGFPDTPDLRLTNFVSLLNGSEGFGAPSTPVGYYNYLRSTNLLGSPITLSDGQTPTHWMFAGYTYENPAQEWYDVTPGDKQMLLSSGPFTYEPAMIKCLSNAYIYARSETDEESSLDKLLAVSDLVQADFDNCFNCVPPLADIQVNLVGNLTFDFYNLATGDDYFWDFGDGTSSTSMVPTKTLNPEESYEIILTVSNACGSDTDTLELSFEPVGVEEVLSELEIDVFPNPAQDQITLSSEKALTLALQIFDSAGKLVIAETVRSNSPIDLSSLSSGHYVLLAVDAHSSKVFREQLMVFE